VAPAALARASCWRICSLGEGLGGVPAEHDRRADLPLEDSGISAVQLASEARIPMKIFSVVTARSIEAIGNSQMVQVNDHESGEAQAGSGIISLL
jgi:hypothetical protein